MRVGPAFAALAQLRRWNSSLPPHPTGSRQRSRSPGDSNSQSPERPAPPNAGPAQRDNAHAPVSDATKRKRSGQIRATGNQLLPEPQSSLLVVLRGTMSESGHSQPGLYGIERRRRWKEPGSSGPQNLSGPGGRERDYIAPWERERRDGSEDPSTNVMQKTPIILSKPPAERPREEGKGPVAGAGAATPEGTAPPPPTAPAPPKGEKEGQRPTQPVYQIQNRGMGTAAPTAMDPVVGQAKLLPPERMKHSIKLVDDQMNWCDSAIEVQPPRAPPCPHPPLRDSAIEVQPLRAPPCPHPPLRDSAIEVQPLRAPPCPHPPLRDSAIEVQPLRAPPCPHPPLRDSAIEVQPLRAPPCPHPPLRDSAIEVQPLRAPPCPHPPLRDSAIEVQPLRAPPCPHPPLRDSAIEVQPLRAPPCPHPPLRDSAIEVQPLRAPPCPHPPLRDSAIEVQPLRAPPCPHPPLRDSAIEVQPLRAPPCPHPPLRDSAIEVQPLRAPPCPHPPLRDSAIEVQPLRAPPCPHPPLRDSAIEVQPLRAPPCPHPPLRDSAIEVQPLRAPPCPHPPLRDSAIEVQPLRAPPCPHPPLRDSAIEVQPLRAPPCPHPPLRDSAIEVQPLRAPPCPHPPLRDSAIEVQPLRAPPCPHPPLRDSAIEVQPLRAPPCPHPPLRDSAIEVQPLRAPPCPHPPLRDSAIEVQPLRAPPCPHPPLRDSAIEVQPLRAPPCPHPPLRDSAIEVQPLRAPPCPHPPLRDSAIEVQPLRAPPCPHPPLRDSAIEVQPLRAPPCPHPPLRDSAIEVQPLRAPPCPHPPLRDSAIEADSAQSLTLASPFPATAEQERGRAYVFRAQSAEMKERGGNQTSGIDFFITQERIVFLDTQSLQIAAFLFTVCHVVIVVQDWFTDLSLYRFLQTAEMVKPSTPSPSHESSSSAGSDEGTEYYPHLAPCQSSTRGKAKRRLPHSCPSYPVFLQNKARREDFCPRKLRQMHLMIDQLMAHSHLRYKGEHLQAPPRPASYLLILGALPGKDPPMSLVAAPQVRADVSVSQGRCPCCSATSSRGCRPTFWTLRSTCSWCPSWTVTLRVRPHLEQVQLPSTSGPRGDSRPWCWEKALARLPLMLGPFSGPRLSIGEAQGGWMAQNPEVPTPHSRAWLQPPLLPAAWVPRPPQLPVLGEQAPQPGDVHGSAPAVPHNPHREELVRVVWGAFEEPTECSLEGALAGEPQFHYAARIWDGVKKSSALAEYSRLLA
ncbi:hypothetical protein NN561_017275 [Cricetulus griseus]